MTGPAVVLAFAVAVLGQTAPQPRTVRIEGDGDTRLAALAGALRAELAVAGFSVDPPVREREASAAAAVVRLRYEDDCALVTATASGAATFFQDAAGCDEETATDRFTANRVALQVAEWVDAATWVPPAEAQPAPTAVVHAAAEQLPLQDAPDPTDPVSGFVDIGTTMLRAPFLGTRFGTEIGLAMGGRLRGFPTTALFTRVSLAYEWLGSPAFDMAGDRFDTRYGTLAVAGGLERRLGPNWSAELNVNVGLTLMWFVVHAMDPSIGMVLRDHIWAAAPGAAIGIVRRLSDSSSLALEGRAAWLVAGPVFLTSAERVGNWSWPAITVALSFRSKL